MSFTETWNTAYENLPPDSEDAAQGASRIRSLKLAVRERAEVDHYWGSGDDDGKHKQVTLPESASDPSTATNTGYIYTKDKSGATELYYKDDSGNVVQLTSGGAVAVNPATFPSGTKMYFYQDTAPSGWTTSASVADKVIAVKGGTQAYNTSGGTLAGTWTVGGLSASAHTHSFTVSAHTHSITSDGTHSHARGSATGTGGDGFHWSLSVATYAVSSSGAHSHGGATGSGGGASGNTGSASPAVASDGTWRPYAAVGIIAVKD